MKPLQKPPVRAPEGLLTTYLPQHQGRPCGFKHHVATLTGVPEAPSGAKPLYPWALVAITSTYSSTESGIPLACSEADTILIHLGYCIVISDRYAGVRGEKDRPVMHCGPHERVGCLPSLFLLVHSVGFKTLHPARFLCTGCTHMALAIITKAKGGRNCKIQARVCYTCLLQLPKESFSKRQWRPERDNDQMYSGEAPAAEDSPAQSPEK